MAGVSAVVGQVLKEAANGKEAQYRIRFRNRELFGDSKYRPSEGWTDVQSYSDMSVAASSYTGAGVGKVAGAGAAIVISSLSRLARSAFTFMVSGRNVGDATMEFSRGNEVLFRIEFTGVYFTSSQSVGGWCGGC